MELFNSNIKKILVFSQKKPFLYFGKGKSQKNPYISGNGNLLYFWKHNFPSSKNKKTCSEKMSFISGDGTFQLQD